MKSRVVLPQHVYPALSIGKSANSGDLQLSVRLYQAKKDVHHVPYSSAVFTSPAVGFPVFAGQLPACSIVTYRVSIPQCLVLTWSDYLSELRPLFAQWSQSERILWQAQVSDQISDLHVQRFVASMSLDDFFVSSIWYTTTQSEASCPSSTMVCPLCTMGETQVSAALFSDSSRF